MAKPYGLLFKSSTMLAPRGAIKACAAKRKNQTLLIPAFSYAYPSGAGASQIVAIYTVPIATHWTIRYPLARSYSTFAAVLRWVVSGVTFRVKLWQGTTEILPLPVYVGETVPAGTVIEIWTNASNPSTLSSDWTIPIGIMEQPTTSCDVTGSQISPVVCVPPFVYTDFATMITTCAS